MSSLLDPRFIISFSIIAMCVAAYAHNPDPTMNRALIAAFAGAWGYWIGSSSGAAKNADNAGKALDLAATAQPSPLPDAILKPGQTAQATPDPNE